MFGHRQVKTRHRNRLPIHLGDKSERSNEPLLHSFSLRTNWVRSLSLLSSSLTPFSFSSVRLRCCPSVLNTVCFTGRLSPVYSHIARWYDDLDESLGNVRHTICRLHPMHHKITARPPSFCSLCVWHYYNPCAHTTWTDISTVCAH